MRLWGLAPLAPSPVQKQGIATLRGHGAPITCLALAGGRGDAADGGGGSAGSGAQLLSGSLDARVKAWDPWTATCVGTAKCAAPVAAMQPVAALPLLQPHGLFVCGGATVQLLDLRSFKPVAGVVLPAEHGEQVHCFSQCGWDLAVGASHGARVYDLRMLGGTGQAAGGGGSGGRGLPERLRLAGHARPVSAKLLPICCLRCCCCCELPPLCWFLSLFVRLRRCHVVPPHFLDLPCPTAVQPHRSQASLATPIRQ